MASPDDLAIVLPPPSYPTDTYRDYKPFDDFYERTVDEILDEDANLEGLRDTDWPFYSGGDGAGESPAYSLRKGVSNEGNTLSPTPRAIKKSKAKDLTAKSNKLKKKRPAAKREITVIDLCSDDEYPAPENMEIGRDKTKEQGDPKEMNGIGNLQTDTALEDDSDGTLEFVDAMESQEDSANVNTVNKNGVEPGPVDVEAVEANVAAVDEIDVSRTTTTKRVRHRHSMKGSKEEKIIFSSVSESVRGEVLEFIAEHPFMSRFVQPVRRSAKRQFIKEMCDQAESKGLDRSVLYDLIKYVRRLYLDSAGVDAEPLAPDCNDIPFGQEIDDDSTPNPPSRKSHKRGRKERSPGIKNKSSKRRLLDVQKPPHPVSVPEAIEIADDSTGPLSPELPDVLSCTIDEKVTVIQIQSTPDSPIGPAVAVSDGAKVQNNVFDPPVIESTPELPSQPLDLQNHEICEDTTIVQVESTPELPLEPGSATVFHTTETIQTEDIVKSTLTIEETISAPDNEEGSKDAQMFNKIASVGDYANDEAMPESLYEPRIPLQTATDNEPTSTSLNSTIDSETNKNLPAQLSKTQKRRARRKLLKQAVEEEKATETMDDIQPALMLPKIVDFGDDDANSAAQDSATARSGVDDETVSCNSDKSNGPPKDATGMIQENLFLDFPSEPINEAPKKLSKNQQRQERRRAKREKKEKRIQERREKELEAEQQSATSWLKHHNKHDTQDTPMQTLQAKKFQFPKALPKRKVIDPEPRKEKKRKEREHKREQKRERKRKRESLKLELESEFNDEDQYQEDLPADKDLELDGQELDSQLKKHGKQERKRQRQPLALPHDKGDIEDDPTSGIQPSNGSIESHTVANIREENEVSPDYDERKSRVHVAQETPQPEDLVMEKSNSVSTPEQTTPATKGRAIMLTPQRNNSTAAPMLTSTPISQCTSASRSRYGPLSPDPTEWDTDF